MQLTSPAIAPAQHLASKYKNIVFTTGLGGERTTYQGPATPERNALWDDLYSCKSSDQVYTRLQPALTGISQVGISRIPRSSAARLVNKTLPLPGERGQYVIMLNVFHQLHCLVGLVLLSDPRSYIVFEVLLKICYSFRI